MTHPLARKDKKPCDVSHIITETLAPPLSLSHTHTLQRTATHCMSLFRCSATHNMQHTTSVCSVSVERIAMRAHTAPHCNTLQHTATPYNTLHHRHTHYLVPVERGFEGLAMQAHTATPCNTLQHPATPCATPCNIDTHTTSCQSRGDSIDWRWELILERLAHERADERRCDGACIWLSLVATLCWVCWCLLECLGVC